MYPDEIVKLTEANIKNLKRGMSIKIEAKSGRLIEINGFDLKED